MRDLCQQPYRVEINLVHGLSPSRPQRSETPGPFEVARFVRTDFCGS
jgi:hypothetical protein